MERLLITGASGGIGRAIALKLASKSRHLLLHGRNADKLAETGKLAAKAGATSEVLLYDLRNITQIEAMIAQISGKPLNLLVNNAGMAVVKPIEKITFQEWQDAMTVNVTAPFMITQRLSSDMPAGASIVNILSIASKTGFPNWSSYCATKFALEGFSQSVREEFRGRGIRVINIYPSAIDTAIWDGLEGNWPREKMMNPKEVADAVAYTLSRPDSVLVEGISIGNTSGRL
ncbi:MAG: SDR family NAD(P)-dependent oxidoreductase [candidate division Zixibacteria bacterium]|nr:SDR family NAD(P)-dependent oxidoreductase [candidate division Zixibacteria bacterium]